MNISLHIFIYTCYLYLYVVALREAFYIENIRFDLDILRVPSRSPTPISKYSASLGQSDDVWGARGPISGHFWGSRGSGPAEKHIGHHV